jgi:hypothetical protein
VKAAVHPDGDATLPPQAATPVVDDPSPGRVDGPIPPRPQAQAEIDVLVVGGEVRFVEATGRLPGLPPDEETAG